MGNIVTLRCGGRLCGGLAELRFRVTSEVPFFGVEVVYPFISYVSKYFAITGASLFCKPIQHIILFVLGQPYLIEILYCASGSAVATMLIPAVADISEQRP